MPSPSGSSSNDRRQSGCQSPEQPSFDCRLPAIVTEAGLGVCEARLAEKGVAATTAQSTGVGQRMVASWAGGAAELTIGCSPNEQAVPNRGINVLADNARSAHDGGMKRSAPAGPLRVVLFAYP